jgi:hypothetical protein
LHRCGDPWHPHLVTELVQEQRELQRIGASLAVDASTRGEREKIFEKLLGPYRRTKLDARPKLIGARIAPSVDFATGHRDLVAEVSRQPASCDAEPPVPGEDLEAFLLARVDVGRHGSADRKAPVELE